MEIESAYWKSRLLRPFRKGVPVVPYVPTRREAPSRQLTTTSAWAGIESILVDMIDTFAIPTRRCLEFGVEYGYSSAALSSYFESVTGVDTFLGDKHTKITEDLYDQAVARLSPYSNIQIFRSNYQEWIKSDTSSYDLIHVDIIHTYEDTFACGLWSAQHAGCVLFHDTESFPEVKAAVIDVARETGRNFYNFKESYGLGIVTAARPAEARGALSRKAA